jgi:hypothetical protein
MRSRCERLGAAGWRRPFSYWPVEEQAASQEGVPTLGDANRYSELEYLPKWTSLFTREPANPTDARRPLRAERNLTAIPSHVEERVVANDYTIRYDNIKYQITHKNIRPGLRGATVRVEERWDKTVWCDSRMTI